MFNISEHLNTAPPAPFMHHIVNTPTLSFGSLPVARADDRGEKCGCQFYASPPVFIHILL